MARYAVWKTQNEDPPRSSEVGRRDAHQAREKVCGVQERRRILLAPQARVLTFSAIYVPSEAKQLLADLQRKPRRDRVLSDGHHKGIHREFSCDDPARLANVFNTGNSPAARTPGCLIAETRRDSAS